MDRAIWRLSTEMLPIHRIKPSQMRGDIRSNETGAVRSTIERDRLVPDSGFAPGEYTIEASATGFATTTRTTRLEVGQTRG